MGAPLEDLADKRVAVIGTGATAVQCVPHLARACRELSAFQRTPSSVDVRDNHPIDPEWFDAIFTPGWQQRWLENFTAIQTGASAEEDLVRDGWTDLARRIQSKIRALPPEDRTQVKMVARRQPHLQRAPQPDRVGQDDRQGRAPRLDQGSERVEVTKEAEDAWIELLLSGGGRMLGSPDCTPGYYNNEGRDPGPAAKLNVGYPKGAAAYFSYLDEWRRSGDFEGLAFR